MTDLSPEEPEGEEIDATEDLASFFIEEALIEYRQGATPQELYTALTVAAKVSLMFDTKGEMC